MALPSTGITTSMVASAIGASTNDVGTLCSHSNVNQFGFNSPDLNEMNKYWGKTATERAANNTGAGAIGYPLGVFRNYDHNWLTFRAHDIELDPSIDDYYDPINVWLNIIFAAGFLASKPLVSVAHKFDVYFKRTNDFEQGNGTLIAENVDGYYPYLQVTINIFSPPDGGAALAENSVFYLKFVHKSSPERRWFISGQTHQVAEAGGDYYIGQITVPNDPYTYLINLGAFSAIFNEYEGANTYNVDVTIDADLRVDTQVPVTVQISKSSDFSTDVFTVSQDVSVAKNTAHPGTTTPSGSAVFSFPTAAQKFNVGDTVYYHINVNNKGYNTTQTKTVTATPLQQ